MPTTIKLPRMLHDYTHMRRVSLLVANMILLVLISLMLLTPVFDPAAGWSDKQNLFAVLMLIGLALVPVSLLVSAYFAKGDPLAYPICRIVATYNILAAAFLFYHVAHSPSIDALDLTYS
ncbi:MAG TPA: hypothetical protein VNI58_09710, partial [Mariprofundaceae bacterium]|nr:hypothetical protein [Mariprofundaceae bacterium]